MESRVNTVNIGKIRLQSVPVKRSGVLWVNVWTKG